MSWSPAMREARRAKGGQSDMFDDPILDYGLVCDGGTRPPLTNKMVTARKAHECFTCERGIAKGERIRAESRRSDDGNSIETRRVCAACCRAIAKGGQPWRSAIGGKGDCPSGTFARPSAASGAAATSEGQTR